jgi:hypothetical protein
VRNHCTLAVLILLPVAVASCDVPRFPGPEIQAPPPGFVHQPDATAKRDLFPGHEPTFHTAWVHADIGGASVISVDGYATAFTLDDVIGAREIAEEQETDPDAIHGEMEAIRIDGRDGWGWYDRIESDRRGREQVTYTAVIPYESASYAIELVTEESSFKRAAPDTLRAVVETFAIGQTTYNVPLIAVVLGAMLLLVSVLRARSRERADRLRSVNLVTVPTGEEGGEPGSSEATAAASPGSQPPPPPDLDHPDPGARF